MKRHALLPAFALLAACGSPGTARAQADPMMARLLDIARSRIGVADGSGLTMTAARAEGRTLVLVMEASPSARAEFPAREVADRIGAAFCGTPDNAAFFSEGRTLRIELTGGQPAAGAQSDRLRGTAAEAAMQLYVRDMQSLVGRTFEALTIESVRAEGDVLVILMNGPASGAGA